jgi:glycosyltransferase involved in cell wall biosynthesis
LDQNQDEAIALTAGADLPPPPPMRVPAIMQVLPSLVTGGVERGATDVSAAIVAAGWKSVVVSEGGPMVREIERAGGIHVVLPVGSKNPITLRRNVARLVDVARAHDVDLIHARSRAPAWSARFAARELGIPFVTTFHGTYNFGNPVKRWYNSIMAKGTRVIAISDFIARHVTQNYGTPGAILRTIHRGVDVSRFDPVRVSAERVIKLSRDWRLPDGLPVVMLPGRLTRWKGQTLLIDAAAKLGRRDVVVLFVGSDQGRTAYRKELEALVRKRGLEGVVRIVDHCNDMAAAYMLSDVVVSASTDPEAFGRVVAEAQAMGRPVVAPDHGGAPEILKADETGWLFKPGDAGDLAEALKKALALDPAARDDLAGHAIANVNDRFTKERMCAATLDVYEEVLRESRPEVWGR